MEAVTAYHNLFSSNGGNAAAICFKRCRGLGAANWTDFPHWDAHLGQLVQRNQPWPTFLFAIDRNRGDWPMTQIWQKFHNWVDRPAAYVLPSHQSELIQVNRAGINGPRKVILKREAMTPQLVQGAQAVVLSRPPYMQHRGQWPAETWIMLLMPPSQAGQIPEQDARFLFLGNKKRSLGRILESIARICDQHNIQRVASVGIGYEDEGPELDRWRRQAGMPLELTIYCEHEGDVVSFGPCADVIQ
jgi:hypothetical protein